MYVHAESPARAPAASVRLISLGNLTEAEAPYPDTVLQLVQRQAVRDLPMS